MRLTGRDATILKDLALSHVLSRDQIMNLGYFGSVTRVNTRLRELVGLGLVRRLDTPFFGQSLYIASKRAAEVVGERVSALLDSRVSSPRFVQHALSVTNVRIALFRESSAEWRFEQQLWRKLKASRTFEIRPDGLLMTKQPIFVEVDMGHASSIRFGEKLTAYQALAQSGKCPDLYGFDRFRVLTVTTSPLRARHLLRKQPQNSTFDLQIRTFDDLGVTPISPWS